MTEFYGHSSIPRASLVQTSKKRCAFDGRNGRGVKGECEKMESSRIYRVLYNIKSDPSFSYGES